MKARFAKALRIANDDRLNRSERPAPKGASAEPWRNSFGATVCVYTREDAGADADEPWLASCETHGQQLSCSTKRNAVRSARQSWEWCSECRANLPP
jgi:hypothetical protein